MQATISIKPAAESANNADSTVWVALDDPAEWVNFSQVHDEKNHAWESRLAIEGMHCAACAINVEKALKALPGVLSADVNATSGRARLVWSADFTKPSEWMRAVIKAGYRALPAADAFIQDSRRKNQRLMLWRLLVAGFCMMQVMMYAMPTYYASPGEMTADALNLMRWASWILTLPVLFFSCGPFFSNALNDLKQHQISMDMPVTLGIVITFLVSSAATFEPSGWWGSEVYFDSLTMFVFFLLVGRWIELRMRDRTAGSLDALMRRLPISIERLKLDGTFERVAVRNLNVADVVRVLPGEAFPADGTILLGDTNSDEALLTGESRPVSKTIGSEAIAGSYNLTAPVQVRIDKIGQSTRYGQIVTLMERVAVDKPRLALLADRIARPFLLAVLFAAVASAAFLWHTDHSRALMAAVAVLIVTCPCALSLATPAAMLTVSGALARSGILVRRMQALEALTTIDTIVFDKTGTLTEDKMTIGEIVSHTSLSKVQALHIAAALAQHSLHPVSRALVDAAKLFPIVKVDSEIENVKEVTGSGLTANSIYGHLKLGSAQFCVLDNVHIDRLNEQVSKVHLVSDHGWLASFEIVEAIKPDALFAISTLQQNNVKVEVLSGDQASSVTNVTNKLGIKSYIAECTPQHKLAHIQALQKQGHHVAMVGDGLNDGPVLATAHVSIAMGQAVPLAQAQSDFVVMGGQLSMVPHLITQAKRTMRIVKQNLIWAAAYNAVCVPLAVTGLLPAWLAGLGMALSSLLVILNAARLSRGIAPVLELT
jgi:P-type Cu2+ transporter